MSQSLVAEFTSKFPLPIEVLLIRAPGAVLLCGLIGFSMAYTRILRALEQVCWSVWLFLHSA